MRWVQQRHRRRQLAQACFSAALQNSVFIASTPPPQSCRQGQTVAAMEAAVVALLELLDGSEINVERYSAALRRIRAERLLAPPGTAAVSDRAVHRLLAQVHAQCNPAEDAPSVLSDRLLTANAAVECVRELLMHPEYAASAALRTRESVYALFDALTAADRHAGETRTAGAELPNHLAQALARSITAAAASISECSPPSPDDPDPGRRRSRTATACCGRV